MIKMTKKRVLITLLLVAVAVASSCKHIIPPKESNADIKDTLNVSGFTGVKKFYDQGKLVKDVTYRDGIKEGICHNYYDDGRLKRTIIYSNNLKTDTARYYYREGMVYRATPYKDDKINGIQTKYYKSGMVQAELPYVMGLRISGLREFYENGLEVGGIPTIETEINDSYYDSHGIVRIVLKLSNDSKNVEFYRGSLTDGAFDENKCTKVTISTGMGYLELKKDDNSGRGYIDVISVYTTPRFRNKEIITKRIKLPYNNLI